MDKIDPALEQRVWKRVRGESAPAPEGLQALVAAAQSEAAVYLMLSRQLQGREKALLRRLFEEEQTNAAMLRGIHRLITGQTLAVRTPSPEPEIPESALRKCYGRTLRAAESYESRVSDREYGCLFSAMAQREYQHLSVIAEILGILGR